MSDGTELQDVWWINPDIGNINSTLSRKRKQSLESKLSKYKNRMELLRTVIGVIVLGLQLVIVYNLLKK